LAEKWTLLKTYEALKLEIDRCGFFEADTDISKKLKYCFLLHYQNVMYFMRYLFSKPKIRIYKQEFMKLQHFQYLISLAC